MNSAFVTRLLLMYNEQVRGDEIASRKCRLDY